MANNSSSSGKDPCLVCGKLTSGLHFEMTICRACAMFARRSYKSKKQYKCQRGTGTCAVKAAGKICRYCRFKRCKQLGITCKTVDKEASKQLEQAVSPPTDDTVEVPTDADASGSAKKDDIVNFDVNCESVIATVKMKLSQQLTITPLKYFTSPVLEMQQAFERTMRQFIPTDINAVMIVQEVDKSEEVHWHEQYISKTADFLLGSSQYCGLDFQEKFLIFRHVWMKIHVLERLYASIRLFGNDPNDHRVLQGKNRAMDVDHARFQWKDVPREKLERVEQFCKPMIKRLVDTVLVPMKAVALTDYEFIYLCIQIMWSFHEVAGVSDDTKKIAEDITDHASNDLHNYYVGFGATVEMTRAELRDVVPICKQPLQTYEMRMPNYAMRLARLMKLMGLVEKHIQTCKEFITMGRIFSVFECDFYDSELMD